MSDDTTETVEDQAEGEGDGWQRVTRFYETVGYGAAPLLEGIDPNQPDIGQLINNFQTCGFVWDGTTHAAAEFLAAGGAIQADCRTIAEAFVQVAHDALGLTASMSPNVGEIFLPGGGMVMGGWNGNVDDGAHWAFTSHYYAIVNGTAYDLLFYGAPPAQGNWILKTTESEIEVDGGKVAYRQFGDWYVYPWEAAGAIPRKLTLDWDRAVAGVGLTNQKLEEMAQSGVEAKEQRLQNMDEVEKLAEDLSFDERLGHTDERVRAHAVREELGRWDGAEGVLDEFVAKVLALATPCNTDTLISFLAPLRTGNKLFPKLLIDRYQQWKEGGFSIPIPNG